MILLAGLLLIALVPMLVKRRRGRAGVDAMVPAGAANGLEAVCEYLRKEVADRRCTSTPIASSSTSGASSSSC